MPTSVRIRSEKPKRNSHAIFVSAGDRETFATYALDNLTDAFDVLVFQYGSSTEKQNRFTHDATVFAHGSGTKFNALRHFFLERPDLLERYETIWVCDDDLILEYGDYRDLPVIQKALNVGVLSPAHSIQGKISHQIMLPRLGLHVFRHTSFVEMTCPLFSTEALLHFLRHYDGSLRGYAEDWWFLWVLGAQKKGVAGIADNVTIINPHNKNKPGGYGEAELQGVREDLRLYWLAAMQKQGMKEWPASTLSYVYRAELRDKAPHIDRPAKDIVGLALSMLNYKSRLYGIRKKIARVLGARKS